MKVEQISIFLENKPGGLSSVTRAIKDAQINIRALSLADTAEFGILRLIVDQNDRAKQALKEGGFTVARTEVVALEVPDRPGGLARILRGLDDAGINVEYMYAFVRRSGDNAILVVRFDEPGNAVAALTRAGVRVLLGPELYAL